MSTIKKGEFVTGDGLAELLKGKTIKHVLQYSRFQDNYLAFVFTDGTSLEIRYDWLYGWELVDHDIKLSERIELKEL